MDNSELGNSSQGQDQDKKNDLDQNSLRNEDPEVLRNKIAQNIDMEDIEEEFNSLYLQKIIEKGCTSTKGSTAQTIYSCSDCPGQLGCCMACITECHHGHQIFEVGLRRSFVCDCGGKKCCKLTERNYEGFQRNPLNKYNHNFDNKFCHCLKEACENDDMVQCSSCEDFIHVECSKIDLEVKDEIKNSDLGSEVWFFCKNCLNDKLQFLLYYPELHITDGPSSKNYLQNELFKNASFIRNQESELKNEELVDRFETFYEKIFFRSVKSSMTEKTPYSNSSSTINSLNATPTKDSGKFQKNEVRVSTLGKRNKPEGPSCEILRRQKLFKVYSFSLQSYKAVLLQKFFASKVCQCRDCQVSYYKIDPSQQFLSDILDSTDDTLDDSLIKKTFQEAEIKAQQKLEKISSNDAMVDMFSSINSTFKTLTGKQMDYSHQIKVSEFLGNLKEVMTEAMSGPNKNDLTEEDAKKIMNKIGQKMDPHMRQVIQVKILYKIE